MEPDFIPYLPMLNRPKLSWPDGKRVALWICPNIEHYEFQPKFQRVRDPWPRSAHPDILGYSLRDYGNRVGLWRLFAVMDELELKATVSLSMAVLQHYPAIFEAMETRGWELMSHGLYNTRYHWNFTPAEERAAMEESRQIHRAMTGREQRGWFSPAISNTLNTFEIAAEVGYDYICDLYHDDQPFPITTKTGDLISVPYTVDINDVMAWRKGDEIDAFCRQIRDYFETVYAEGETQGRVMCIALHPFWIGQPHRIRAFRRVMEYILSHSGVWVATAAEIADHARATQMYGLKDQIEQRSASRG